MTRPGARREMTNREFLDQVEAGVPIEPGSPLHRKLDELGWEARWRTNYLNCVAHRPHIVRAILERLTGRPVPHDVELLPPLFVQIGIGLHFGRRVRVDQDVHLLDIGGIHLADGVTVCTGVTIMTTLPGTRRGRRDVLYPAPVRVGKDVWIGPGVTVLPGVTIGEGAIISPGSLVSGDVDPGTVSAGRPAAYVRDL